MVASWAKCWEEPRGRLSECEQWVRPTRWDRWTDTGEHSQQRKHLAKAWVWERWAMVRWSPRLWSRHMTKEDFLLCRHCPPRPQLLGGGWRGTLGPGAEDPEIFSWGLAREVEVTGGQRGVQQDVVGRDVGHPWPPLGKPGIPHLPKSGKPTPTPFPNSSTASSRKPSMADSTFKGICPI